MDQETTLHQYKHQEAVLPDRIKRGYSLDFKMFMEGVEVAFHSATVKVTPNGAEASVNVFANEFVYDLKPKTAVQIFYRDWVYDGDNPPWRIMFDGFFSSFYKQDQAKQGRMLSLVCRDFRMDIRKAPAAMCYQGNTEISTNQYYNSAGIFQKIIIRGVSTSGGVSNVRTYDTTKINDLWYKLKLIAGTAYGVGAEEQEDGTYRYTSYFGKSFKEVNGKAECGYFLDALIRGIWSEAVGGTSVGSFLNKRVRMDKRFLVPVNRAGYNFWSRKNASLMAPSYVMGNSRFSSLEAVIMRLAGLFSVRPYVCSSPSLIPIEDESVRRYFMDEDVYEFLVENEAADFGGKYILNETMMLPPLEFTSPPNCNLIFPPMYDRVVWQHDMDSDFTRGHFDVANVWTGGHGLGKYSVQIPTALFNKSSVEGNPRDEYNRKKPPITLDERYNGVNVYYGTVSSELAQSDAIKSMIKSVGTDKRSKEIEVELASIKQEIDSINNKSSDIGSGFVLNVNADTVSLDELNQQSEALTNERSRIRMAQQSNTVAKTNRVLEYHALVKYSNVKYQGRVVSIEMQFNPYIISGFPGAVVADVMQDEPDYMKSEKTMIGMVQQVQHSIVISNSGAEAATSAVMTNVRFSDEATDIDSKGYPLYMRPTNPTDAEIDIKTFEFINQSYNVPDGVPVFYKKLNEDAYDYGQRNESDQSKPDGKYAKDFLSRSLADEAAGKINRIYLDRDYEPNRISGFYNKVLRERNNHFMIDSFGNNQYFVYDTMHEAFDTLPTRRPELYYDYGACIRFIQRDICTAQAFFGPVMGLSQKVVESGYNGVEIKYIRYSNRRDDHDIQSEYFGISTEDWENGSVDSLKTENNGLMDSPGQLSSILEFLPKTAFIKERKDAVKNYVKQFNKAGIGVKYTYR